jgi:hypothetical protein
MASAGMPAFQPAGRGDFDSFGQTLVGFLFRHLTDSFKITKSGIIKKIPNFAIYRKMWPKNIRLK